MYRMQYKIFKGKIIDIEYVAIDTAPAIDSTVSVDYDTITAYTVN